LKVDVVVTIVWEDDIPEDCTKGCFDRLDTVYGLVVDLERIKELEIRANPRCQLIFFKAFMRLFLFLLFWLNYDDIVLSYLIKFLLMN
jgi:hypothetical protein